MKTHEWLLKLSQAKIPGHYSTRGMCKTCIQTNMIPDIFNQLCKHPNTHKQLVNTAKRIAELPIEELIIWPHQKDFESINTLCNGRKDRWSGKVICQPTSIWAGQMRIRHAMLAYYLKLTT